MTVSAAPLKPAKTLAKPKAKVPYFAGKKVEKKTETTVKETDRLASSKKNIKQAANKSQKHDDANDKVKETKNAALLSSKEANMAEAKKHQAEKMGDAKKEEFSALVFKTQLLEKVNSQLPTNEERANKFKQKGLDEKVKETIDNDLKEQKNKAGGDIEKTSNETAVMPAGAEPNANPQAIIPENPGERTYLNKNSPLMPAPKPESATNLDKEANNLDTELSKNEIKPETLKSSNEPKFTGALTLKTDAQSKAKSFKNDFQKIENPTIAHGTIESREAVNKNLGGMFGSKTSALSKKQKEQEKQREKENKIRLKVKFDLDAIYDTTKDGVNQQFKDLDDFIKNTFDTRLSEYLKTFDKDVKEILNDNQGWSALGKWFSGEKILDQKEVYIVATTNFNNNISPIIDQLSNKVEEKLNKAKEITLNGKTKSNEYWNNQDKATVNIAKDIFDGVTSKYEELEKSIESKEAEVLETISTKLVEAQNKLDESFERIKEENKSWLEKAYDAVVGVIKDILEIKNTLSNLLNAIIEAIDAIISDPIGFLKNLLDGVAQGFKNFGANFLKHLIGGFISWLTGALPGIEIPEDIFSLKGIFNLVMQVLGLSWSYIRSKAVKLLGEPAVKVIETAFEIFMIFREKGIEGVWEYLKEKFNDLKAKIIDEIQSMILTQVIEAGINWIIGLSNPVGAFIKAAMAIIDTVKFFFQKAKEIISLVDAITQGILNIAKGNVKFVADAVENALARTIPLIIGFLASLLKLNSIPDKVKNIIGKIRQRIDEAIDGFIEKAKTWFKLFIKNPKNAIKGIIKWFGIKRPFTAAGKPHNIWLEERGGKSILIVASAEEPLASKLGNWLNIAKNEKDKDGQTKIIAAQSLNSQIISSSEKLSKESDETKKITLKSDLDSKESQLLPILIDLFRFENVTDNKNPLAIFIGRKVKGDADFEAIANKNGYNIGEKGRISRKEGMAAAGLQKLRINKVDILVEGETGEHNNYKPKDLKISLVKGGFRLDYIYENGTTFHTIIEFGSEAKSGSFVRSSTGDDLEIKEAGTRGRTNSSGELMSDNFKESFKTKIPVHSAHLIADWFSGSGYKGAGNIVPTSDIYNTETMGNVEKDFAKHFESDNKFTLTVKAKTKFIDDKSITDALAKEKIDTSKLTTGGKELVQGFKEGADLSPELETIAKDKFFGLADPAYIESVVYEGKKINDKSAKLVKKNIGEDEKLKTALGM